MTVATNSRAQKKVILDYLQDTGESVNDLQIPFNIFFNIENQPSLTATIFVVVVGSRENSARRLWRGFQTA